MVPPGTAQSASLPGDRIARGWLARALGPLRRRFFVLLTLLVLVSAIPWRIWVGVGVGGTIEGAVGLALSACALIVVLIGYGIWEVFERIRRLGVAASDKSPQQIAAHARGADEVGALARALESGLLEEQRRADTERERVQRLNRSQVAVQRFADDLNQWITGEGELATILGELAGTVGFGAVWVDTLVRGARPVIAGHLTQRVLDADWMGRGQVAAAGGQQADNGDVEVIRDEDAERVLVAPLGWGRQQLGVLGVLAVNTAWGGEQERVLVATLAQCLGLALLARRRLLERERQSRIATLLAVVPELAEGARELGAGLRAVVSHRVAIVALWGEEDEPEQTWRIDAEAARRIPISCGLQAGDVVEVLDREALERCPVIREEQVDGALVVPLAVEGRSFGLVALANGSFDSEDIAAAQAMAPVLSSALARMRLESRVRRAQQIAVLGRFGRNLAHEVRNPLNGLTLHLELLERRIARGSASESERQAAGNAIGVLRAEVGRINSLVEDYLTFSPDGRPLPFQRADLRDIVSDVLTNQGPILEAAEVALDADLGGEEAPVRVHRAKIQQILQNLITNAVEVMAGRPERQLTVTLARDPGGWAVTVRDTGPGLDDTEAVFSPTYGSGHIGQGVTLTVSRQIARVHGGQLAARRAPGGGAELVLTLPLEANAPSMSGVMATQPPGVPGVPDATAGYRG